MYIESLHVYKTIPSKETIRFIKFNTKGLNLIIDNTSNIPEDSGNSVGKSTVIHIIDLCLNAKSVNILYKSTDGEGENLNIKKVLSDSKVIAEITLSDGKTSHTFSRSLYNNGKRFYNGEVLTKAKYEIKLKEILFDSILPNPTFRQLISKFVRTDEIQLNNVLYYLPSTSKEVFESIYFFLYKFNSLENINLKQQLDEEKRLLEIQFNYYKNDPNIPSLDFIEQGLLVMDAEIHNLINLRKEINYIEKYKEELNSESNLLNEITLLQGDIELLNLQKSTLFKNLDKLTDNEVTIDLNIIQNIYSDASKFALSLNKTFEDVVSFHNQMIINRKEFINKQINEVDQKIKLLNNQLDLLIDEKKNSTIEILDKGLLNEINIINQKIDEINVSRGEYIKAQKIMKDIMSAIENIEIQISGLKNSTNDYIKILNDFNTFFTAYSEKLYGEKFILVHEPNWKNLKAVKPFNIGNLKGNLGIGKQRALSVAFDLAYISFALHNNIKSPSFVIYDQMENTHINQLLTLFEISKDHEGQLIIPILKERITNLDIAIINQVSIIELSQSDKFFGID